MSAFIEQLQAQLIQVNAAIFGGERFVKENGQVTDQGSRLPGFSLDGSGRLKASGAEISGHIEADSGTLNAVTIEEQAVFRGRILSDHFRLDYDPNSMRRFPLAGLYASGTALSTVLTAIRAFLGNLPSRLMVESGQFNNDSIRAMEFTTRNTPLGSVPAIRIERTNGTLAWATHDHGSQPLAGSLWFTLGTGGKQVRFPNLPMSSGGAPGTVYRESDGRGGFTVKVRA